MVAIQDRALQLSLPPNRTPADRWPAAPDPSACASATDDTSQLWMRMRKGQPPLSPSKLKVWWSSAWLTPVWGEIRPKVPGFGAAVAAPA